MDIREFYKEHVATREAVTESILAAHGYEGLLIDAGRPFVYFADDQEAPFKPNPHFSHWCPERGPHHLLHIQLGKKPRLLRYHPQDFWHEHQKDDTAFWLDAFAISEVSDLSKLWETLGPLKRHAYIGTSEKLAQEQGLEVNPKSLLAALDWERGLKTAYEVYCLQEANQRASRGHKLVRQLFLEGASELKLHLAYLEALACCEKELPYGSIIAMDEKSAVLHYQFKRQFEGGKVLLIDAGAEHLGYASDITRTYARPEAADEFKALLLGMEALQQELCQLLAPKISYLSLHEQAHHKIAKLLLAQGVLKACSLESAVSLGLSKAFFPHGLGHMLGLQVHDVGGLQKNAKGEPCDRSEKFPQLRTARDLRAQEVITMEPGLYFIPMLLNPLRSGPLSQYLHWPLIDRLMPLGGIRIEDDLYLSKEGPVKNLTRACLGNDCLLV